MSPTSTPIQVLTVDSLAWLVTSTLRRPRADLALPPSAAAWPRRQPAAARVAHDSCADEFGSASYGGPRRRAAGLVDQLLVVEAAPQRWLVRWCTQRPRPRRARLPCGTSDPAGPGVRNFVGGAMDSNSFPRPTHNVRRPRKHCVSDTPHAPARAPRDAHARAPGSWRAPVRDSAVQQSAPYCSSGATSPPRAGAPASCAPPPPPLGLHRIACIVASSRPAYRSAAAGGPRRGVSRRGERHRRRRRARTSYRHTQG